MRLVYEPAGGIVVGSVVKGGRAWRQGVDEGDRLSVVNKRASPKTLEVLGDMIAALASGRPITILFERRGQSGRPVARACDSQCEIDGKPDTL